MKRQTIFCDFDGPIVDVSDRYYKTYQLGLQEIQSEYEAQGRSLSIQPMTKAQFWSMKRHRIPDVEIAMRSGLDCSDIDKFLDRVKDRVNQPQLLHYDRLQPGIEWALNLFHKHEVRLVLVTLRCQEQATQFLHEQGLLPLFTGVYGTQDKNAAYLNVTDWKVSLLKQAWHEHLCRYGRPIQSWMVGDTEADIRAGQVIGIPTVAITSGIRSQSYLEKFNPNYTYESLLSAAHGLMRPSVSRKQCGQEVYIGSSVRSTA